MFSGSIEVDHWLKMDQRDQRDLLTFRLTLMVQTKKSKQCFRVKLNTPWYMTNFPKKTQLSAFFLTYNMLRFCLCQFEVCYNLLS